MDSIVKRLASEVEVQPAYVKNMERHGLCFFTWHSSNSVGAQCSNCNTILWLNSLTNKILNEEHPSDVPNSGDKYKNYYKNKINRFLRSLPDCPECGRNSYDRFITNTSYPRYADGAEFDDIYDNVSLKNVDAKIVSVWWLNS